MSAEHGHRLARLDEERLLVAQPLEGGHDRLEALPVAGRLARAAVDHQLLRPLGDLRIEVVHQHPQGGLLLPAAAGDLRAARSAHGAGAGGGGRGGGGHGGILLAPARRSRSRDFRDFRDSRDFRDAKSFLVPEVPAVPERVTIPEVTTLRALALLALLLLLHPTLLPAARSEEHTSELQSR